MLEPPVPRAVAISVRRRRFAYLALGGGTGHLLRALAFARAAALRGHGTRILASSHHTARLTRALAPPEAEVRGITGAAEDLRREARLWLGASRDDVLVVDTFPRGLVGELDGLAHDRPRLLVHRDLADAYALRSEVVSAARAFDARIAPGEEGPLVASLGATRTAAWILAASTTIAPRAAARAAWGLAEGDARPLVVFSTTGDDHHARGLAALARALRSELEGVHVRLVELEDPQAPVPLAAQLGGVDLWVGAGGYHVVHEARATATPLCALAAPRTYDVQARRLTPHERARDLDEVARRVRYATPRTTTPPPSIVDGAAEGVDVAESLA